MRHALVLLASLLASAPLPAEEPSVQRQAELHALVVEDCGACHGARLKGGLGPALSPDRLAAIPSRRLEQTILEGRDGTPMPPWKAFLTPGEARWIVQQLKQGRWLRQARDGNQKGNR